MNPKTIIISLTASLLLSTGCAAKNRWFSRKDYSEVQDPFMEGSEVAAADPETGDTAGRAKLGGGSLSAPGGPKPITRNASATAANSATSGGNSRATAAYPDEGTGTAGTASPGASPSGARSLSGPALSDFLNSGGKSIPAEQPAAGAGRVASNLADPKSAAQRPSSGALSPAARAAAMPTLEQEEATFSGFMQKQTAAMNATAQKATNKVQETEQSTADFAEWASQQKAQWTQSGTEAVETVKAAPTAAKNKVRAVSHEARTAVDEAAVDFMTTPEFDSSETFEGEEDAAEPLIAKPSAKTAAKTATKSGTSNRPKAQPIPTEESDADFEFDTPKTTRTSAEEVSEDPNPFENPFDFEEQTVEKPVVPKAKSSAAKKSSRPTIDESFEMDSGWKPSDMSRP